jgi:hypothetical protein
VNVPVRRIVHVLHTRLHNRSCNPNYGKQPTDCAYRHLSCTQDWEDWDAKPSSGKNIKVCSACTFIVTRGFPVARVAAKRC